MESGYLSILSAPAESVPASARLLEAYSDCITGLTSSARAAVVSGDVCAQLSDRQELASFKQQLSQVTGFSVQSKWVPLQNYWMFFPSEETGFRLLPEKYTPQVPILMHSGDEDSPPKSPKRIVRRERKNPARPLNCFMLFREDMRMKLKDDPKYSHLSVQELSKCISKMWSELSAEWRDHWKAKANAKKEEHMRMYPDYKYCPRKPGEKKKRQSRKAQAVAASAASPEASMSMSDFNLVSEAATNASISGTPATGDDFELFDFNAFLEASELTPDTNLVSDAATNAISAYFNDALPSDGAQLAEIMHLHGAEPQEPIPTMSPAYLHHAEVLRQGRLEAELAGSEYDFGRHGVEAAFAAEPDFSLLNSFQPSY